MATNYNYFGGIVTNGLVLDLDAAKVASYPGTGTSWYDISGNNNNGTLTNGPTFSGIGKQAAIVFDGTNDFVVASSVKNIPALNANFTVNLFTKPTVATYGNILILADSGYNNECQIITNSTTVVVTKFGGTTLVSGGTLSLNTWYNIVYIQNNSTGSLYINGSQIASDSIVPQIAATSNIILGAYNTSGPEPYGGYTAIAQIYNRALSATEVSQNFNALRGRYGI
jgi:hypothetical protein